MEGLMKQTGGHDYENLAKYLQVLKGQKRPGTLLTPYFTKAIHLRLSILKKMVVQSLVTAE